jgi:protein-S-isoprenylcysteine O-methyltransferase Ste14
MFWLFFVICFICFGMRTIYNYWIFRKQRSVGGKRGATVMNINMAVLWAAWFSMNFWDPVRTVLPVWLRYVGLLLFVVGVLFFVLGDFAMRGLANKEKIVKSGIFSRIRHPVYLGFCIWVVGFPIFIQSMLTLASAVLWVGFFMCWKRWEEQDLERKFPEYHDYKKQTWF